MSESKARRYFQQIVLAVKYLHKKNIIHRDLKPENILIDKKNNCIKITDFGLSALINRKDQVLHDIAGTTDYLAPEVIKQTGYLGQSADIWSCGVILYNCITGNKPFTGSNSKMLNNILTGNAEYGYNRIPKNLIDLFKQIFDPNPTTRYTIDQIMEHEWFKEGFDDVKNAVEDFMEKNKEEVDNDETNLHSSNNKTLKCIDTVYINQKNFAFNMNEIPLVTCFELALMCYGKTVSGMFNNGATKRSFCEMKWYRFICRKGHVFGCGLMKEYFGEVGSDCEFSKVEHDQVMINVLYKDSIVSMKLQVVKVSKEGKCIFVISYQNGILNDYFKIMKGFFDKNKAFIEKC